MRLGCLALLIVATPVLAQPASAPPAPPPPDTAANASPDAAPGTKVYRSQSGDMQVTEHYDASGSLWKSVNWNGGHAAPSTTKTAKKHAAAHPATAKAKPASAPPTAAPK